MSGTPETSQCNSESGEDDMLPVTDGTSSKLLPRPTTLEEALHMARASFPELASGALVFSAKLKAPHRASESDFVNIPEDLWEFLFDRMSLLRISVPLKSTICEPATNGSPGRTAFSLVPISIRRRLSKQNHSDEVRAAAKEGITVDIVTATGNHVTFNDVSLDSTVADLTTLFCQSEGLTSDQVSFLYGGRQLMRGKLKDYGLGNPAQIDVALTPRRKKARKPVIYLFPPSPIQARVSLSLLPEWEFDVVYPVVPITTSERGCGQAIEWKVFAQPNGDLKEDDTGLDVSYLFWEARIVPIAGNPFTNITSEVFVPGASDCRPSDSVLLSADKVPGYLDKALFALGLHIEARTSFITYWLPDILKHSHIALRFVPQTAYEDSAPLSITPRPDVTTRVFMLFQGVRNDQVHLWDEVQDQIPMTNPAFWVDMVGTDAMRQSDVSLFRVLEWGGMEVVRV